MKLKTGIGYDVHQLVEGKKLMIGGIEIPHSKGSLGHSDGDVLIHAICDALLGAANLGDIGFHFPDTSEEFKGIDSKLILRKVVQMIKEKEFQIENVDTIIILQQPKVKDYIPKMRKKLAECLQITEDDVSVKATTTEYLGFEGREEGVAAMANVLIMKY